MAFTEYKFSPDFLAKRTAELSANLQINRGYSNLLRFGLGVVADRLKADRLRYRDYGPYWYALKTALKSVDYDMGSHDDPAIREIYAGADDTQTLVAANEFRDDYLKQFFVHANKFVLDVDAVEPWLLFDPDMEREQ